MIGVRLGEIAHERLVHVKTVQQPARNAWRTSHAAPPCSSGKPRHNLTSVRCASRASRNPLAVMRKYFLALPPRSAVGSPMQEATRPLLSSLDSAAYTLPRKTSRPLFS